MTAGVALYATTISHVRTSPVQHNIKQGSYSWLVDLDALPVLPRWLRVIARFEARDHVGDETLPIRRNVERVLSDSGIDAEGGQILMLANARSLGHVFNPLTVYWCHNKDGKVVAVIAEVHNTYGGRHSYVVPTDARGRGRVDKELYVSPFNPVDGYYELSLPRPGDRLTLTVTLHRPEGSPFVATVRGELLPVTPAVLLRLFLRRPSVTRSVSFGIRRHGIALYLKGLRVRPRPAVSPQPHHPPALEEAA